MSVLNLTVIERAAFEVADAKRATDAHTRETGRERDRLDDTLETKLATLAALCPPPRVGDDGTVATSPAGADPPSRELDKANLRALDLAARPLLDLLESVELSETFEEHGFDARDCAALRALVSGLRARGRLYIDLAERPVPEVERPASESSAAESGARESNRLVVVGRTGDCRAYLNVPRDEAVRRFRRSDGWDPAAYGVGEFVFDDEFWVYDASSLRGETG